MATLQSLDIRRRSASNEAPPQIRQNAMEVAKLIDVSKCIGCKACQAACLEWNDLKQEIGYTDGTYNNPTDLTPASWTVMRFTEYEHGDDLEWRSARTAACIATTRAASRPARRRGRLCSTPTASSTSCRRTASAAATA
jgi:ferredoxin